MLRSLPQLVENSVLALHTKGETPALSVIHFTDGVQLEFHARFRTDVKRIKGKDAQLQYLDHFLKAKEKAVMIQLQGEWTHWHGQEFRNELMDLVRREMKRHMVEEEGVRHDFKIYPLQQQGEKDPLLPGNAEVEVRLSASLTAAQWNEMAAAWRKKSFLKKNGIAMKESKI